MTLLGAPVTLLEGIAAYARVCARELEERERAKQKPPPMAPRMLDAPWLLEPRGPMPALDPITTITPEPASTVYLRPQLEGLITVAVHESAHALTAVCLGVRVAYVELREDCSGACAHYGALDVRARCLITGSGLVAEDVVSLESVEQEPDEPDVRRLAELCPDAHARAMLRFALRRFLSDDRVAAGLDVLAAELLLRGEVDGARVEQIVEASGARGAIGKLLG